jgi:hypothetical protein
MVMIRFVLALIHCTMFQLLKFSPGYESLYHTQGKLQV